MAEYIEKQAVLDEIDEEIQEFPECEYALSFSKRWIKKLPPADVRPVVRGRWEWKHRHRGGFRRVTGEDDFGVRHTITVDQRYEIDDPYCPFCKKLNESVFLNFCPNCGADMREADNDPEA